MPAPTNTMVPRGSIVTSDDGAQDTLLLANLLELTITSKPPEGSALVVRERVFDELGLYISIALATVPART